MLAGRRVAVVGGGIGGLTAALALAKRGASVCVYEQAPALSEVGAGLQISPNGGRVLEALGVGTALDARSVAAQALEPHDGVSGRRLARFPFHGKVPHRLVYRPDLIEILAQAARAAQVEILTGTAISAADLPKADLVVGADGLHSVVRPMLNGADAPRFTGQVAWRAVIKGDHPPVTRLYMGPGQHVVSYPLVSGRINIIAVTEKAEWAAEGWSHPGDADALRAEFARLGPPVAALLNQVAACGVWGLHLHPVADRWQDGAGHVLLGDAAHPTLPFLGQGANLAVEDAWALAAALDALPQAQALASYQSARRPRAVRTVAAAAANARNYHLQGPARRCAGIGLAGIGAVAPGLFLRRFNWLYKSDITQWQPQAVQNS